ncbi:MAG: DUF4234 domain-containing protein [Bacilli bacterium]|nr:DUF4234 domain-containing protein [Bacilli bacterium]
MNNFCPHCGAQLPEGATFCGNCGNSVTGASSAAQTTPNNNGGMAPTLTKRDLVMTIILSVVTCGIYGIYWFICLNDDSNKVSGDNSTSGVMALVLTILTCGIYGFYWYYKVGKNIYKAGQMYGKDIADNSIIYLVLGLFGLGIVNYCLMQTDLNKFSVE